jgi:hypothetical protein
MNKIDFMEFEVGCKNYDKIKVRAFVNKDYDGVRMLCFEIEDSRTDPITYHNHFNIEWLIHDIKKVEWLAQVLARHFYDTVLMVEWHIKKQLQEKVDDILKFAGVKA